MKDRWTIHATAAFGLEAVVKKECEDLGFEEVRVEEGHVLFEGGPREIALANIALTVADRVEVEIVRFSCRDFDSLFDRIWWLPWAEILPENARFPVSAHTVKSKLASPSDIQSIAKKAIVEKLRESYHREIFTEDGCLFPVEIRIRKDLCQVLLDTTGEGLFKRGYRKEKGPAPLKETLAAGLVKLSYWTPDRPLFDPFCGSGTILIEAARMARKIDPGLDRGFLAMAWPWVGPDVFKEVRRERMGRIDLEVKLDLMGFDIDENVILKAVKNANLAGVKEDITFVPKKMEEARLQENFGIIITNPPYGKRLEEAGEVETLLRTYAGTHGQLRTWSHFIITPSRDLEEWMGREADRRRKLFNGGLETTYYQFHGPDPGLFR